MKLSSISPRAFRGMRMSFRENVEYCSIGDLKSGTIDTLIINGQWLSHVNRNQLNDKIEILRLSGYIRDGKVIIPKNKIGIIENPDVNGCATFMFDNENGFAISLSELVTEKDDMNEETILVELLDS